MLAHSDHTACWNTRHHHPIRWDEGVFPYEENLEQGLCAAFDIIYKNGLEKVEFLS